MSIKSLIVISSVFVLSACSKGPSRHPGAPPLPQDQQKTEPVVEIVQGQINGQPWAFRSGRAFYKLLQPNVLVVQLWSEDFSDPCAEKTGSNLQMRLTAPTALRTWTISSEDPFNTNLSIFFTELEGGLRTRDNMRADGGHITFSHISGNEVSGVVSGSYQSPRVGGTWADGQFSVPLCF